MRSHCKWKSSMKSQIDLIFLQRSHLRCKNKGKHHTFPLCVKPITDARTTLKLTFSRSVITSFFFLLQSLFMCLLVFLPHGHEDEEINEHSVPTEQELPNVSPCLRETRWTHPKKEIYLSHLGKSRLFQVFGFFWGFLFSYFISGTTASNRVHNHLLDN